MALIKEISSLRLEIREDSNKRGSEDDKKSPLGGMIGMTTNSKN